MIESQQALPDIFPVTGTRATYAVPSRGLVGLHFGPKVDTHKHDELLNKHYRGIIQGVQDQGEEIVITRGKEHIDAISGIVDEIWVPQLSKEELITIVTLADVALDNFGVIRDYGGEMDLKDKVIQINTLAVRQITDIKSNAHEKLFSDSQAITVPLGADFHPDMLDAIPGDRVVIKPERSSGARNVHITTKNNVAKIIASMPDEAKKDGLVAQEYIDMYVPFPPDIRGTDETEQAKLTADSDRKKELRVFQFYGCRGDQVIHHLLPQARIGQPGAEVLVGDYKLFVDPDYLPDEILGISERALRSVVNATGAKEVHGAIDFSFGRNAEGELAWRPVEFNSQKPSFDRGNQTVSSRFDAAVVAQLVRAARK